MFLKGGKKVNPDTYRQAINGELNDRGMRKWRPFASITQQWEGLEQVLSDNLKEKQPILTAEQAEIINQTLQEAIHFNKKVLLTYYKEGHCFTETGLIERVDLHKNIYIFIDEVFELRNKMPLANLIDVRFP